MDDLLGTKIAAILVILLTSFAFGILPYFARRHMLKIKYSEILISSSLCFGGGILMSVVFLHLYVEVLENVEAGMKDGSILNTSFPLGHFIICSGFFLVYLIEELIHLWIHQSHQKHSTRKKCRQISTSESIDRCESHNAVAMLVGCEGSCSVDAKRERSRTYSNNFNAFLELDKESDHSISKSESLNPPVFTITNNEDHVKFSKPDETIIIPDSVSVSDTFNEYNLNISSIRSVLVIVALSLHGAFEGIALGVEEGKGNIWLLCAALTSHKIFIGFSIGMELLEVGVRTRLYVLYMLIFSLASPVGSSIGIIVFETMSGDSSSGQLAITILQGLSGGTILYVTFCEVLERERSKSTGRFFKYLAMLCGFLLIAVLQLFIEEP